MSDIVRGIDIARGPLLTQGRTVGLITTIEVLYTARGPGTEAGDRYWQCLCGCGNLMGAWEGQIHSGVVASCGCRPAVPVIEAVDRGGLRPPVPIPPHIAGHLPPPLSQAGGHKHPLYSVWQNMKRPCYATSDKRYSDIGQKDIKVCDEWVRDPEAFVVWAGASEWVRGKHLMRVDEVKDYSPDNCVFMTMAERGYSQMSGKCGSAHARDPRRCVGVSLQTTGSCAGKYGARIHIGGKSVFLGWYGNIFDAACARRSAEQLVRRHASQ